ncbi:DUF2897 domain-containing protein [Psychromonas sp. psych-6C06]|uniref:DUF2897 family protein n=1 Tax=Psychromonas sp. psych-6C06 TaxID=2058089 RepID=UPI000C340D3E|nr:DUF2897 family protein [Psychromonas sp. psych-6C06]PKF61018.1 DUF2897 domain-containing protein [Psychromonas sp. psych-6C06]
MNGWLIFLIISLVLGIIISNLLLLKQSAKIKIPESVLKSIAERKEAENESREEKEKK